MPPAALTVRRITADEHLAYVRERSGNAAISFLQVPSWAGVKAEWSHASLGWFDDDGFLWLDGRVSDMINRGGLKVFPEEVAEVLRLSPSVADAAVTGAPDERLGDVPVAFVVPSGDGVVETDALEVLCREHLAPYKLPVRIEIVDALPRNEIGKVLTRELGT